MFSQRYQAIREILQRIHVAQGSALPLSPVMVFGAITLGMVFLTLWGLTALSTQCPPVCVSVQTLDNTRPVAEAALQLPRVAPSIRRYQPANGEICYADRIENYGTWSGIGILAQFDNTAPELTFVNGSCIEASTSLDAVLAQLRQNRPDMQWVVVPEFANITNQSPAVPRVQRIGTTQTQQVNNGDVCWGSQMDNWGVPGHGIIAAFTAPMTVEMTDITCESNGRSLNEIQQWVLQTQPAWSWSVVPDFSQIQLLNDVLPQQWQSDTTGSYIAQAGDICWGARLNTWGTDQAPIIAAITQTTPIQFGWMTCERNGRDIQTIVQSLQNQVPQQNWQIIENFTQIANQIPPIANQWQSSSITMYSPRANEICWGSQINNWGNSDQPVIVQFRTATTNVSFTDGGCEFNGRTLTDIQAWLEGQSQRTWNIITETTSLSASTNTAAPIATRTVAAVLPATAVPVVPTKTIAAVLPATTVPVVPTSTAAVVLPATTIPLITQVSWESGPNKATYTALAGDICWGTFINQYGGYGIPIITQFTQASTQITVTAGACERNLDSFANSVARVRREFPQSAWQVVPDFAQINSQQLAQQWTLNQKTSAVQAGDICWGYQIGASINDNWGVHISPVVIQFSTNQAGLYFGLATCERGGRTTDQIFTSLRADTSIKPVFVPDFASISQQTPPAPRWWASGDRTAQFAPRTGAVCWGARVGVLGNGQQRILVAFTKDTGLIDIANGACEIGGRDLNTIQNQLLRDYPDDPANPNDDWWVVGDYAFYDQ